MPGTDDLSGVSLRFVECLDDFFELRRWLGERREILGVDTETEGLDWWRDKLRTIQFGDCMTGWTMSAAWSGAADELLRAYEGPIVMANSKFDMHFLELNGVYVNRRQLHDTRTMAHLIDQLHSTGLKPLAARLINSKATAGERVLKTAMKDSGWTWATVPLDFAPYWQYAALDPVLTARLYEKFRPQIDASYKDVYELEIASTIVLADMERRGAAVDLHYCNTMIKLIEPNLAKLAEWVTFEYGIANVGSDAQVIKYLNDQGITWTKRTKKGAVAFDKEVLQDLNDVHPLIPVIRRYRDTTKLLKSYLYKYIDLTDSGGFLHCSVNPLGARTGRMSISRPSMQNLPRSQHPRNAIVARPGHNLGLIDFDQIEMRLLAHFSQDPAMIEAIRYGDEMTAAGHKGFDVHSMNARGIYNLGNDEAVPKHMRQITKNSGFAKVYGAGLEQFCRTAGVPLAEGEAFLAQYDLTFPGVRAFQNHVGRVGAQRLATTGEPYVVTPMGRRNPSYKDKIYSLTNYLIQSTAADVLKIKLVELEHAGLTEHLILPVHDELIYDIPGDEAAAREYMHEVQKIVQERARFSVPLTADVEIHQVWGHKYKHDNEEIWLSPDLQEEEDRYADV